MICLQTYIRTIYNNKAGRADKTCNSYYSNFQILFISSGISRVAIDGLHCGLKNLLLLIVHRFEFVGATDVLTSLA